MNNAVRKNVICTDFSAVFIESYRVSQELESLDIQTQMVVANLVSSEEQAITPFFITRRSML